MGKIILCTSRLAKNPFIFPLSETKVYSIEELCYYIYHNIYEITVDCFDTKLVKWLRKEVKMEVIADKLDTMIEIGSSLKDIVVSILCSCDYYTETEIKALLMIINDIENLPYVGRQKQKADYCLRYGKYAQAKREYDKIINGGHAVNLTPEEYGNILHNRSMACFYMGAFGEARYGWKEAYNRNNNKKSLRQYLLSLLINNEIKEFENEVAHYNISDEYAEVLKNELSLAYIKAAESEQFVEVEKLGKYSDKEEALKYATDKINMWKIQYREGNG